MNEQADMLDKTVERLFSHLTLDAMPATDSAAALAEVWAKIEELGIPNIFLPEEVGGFNGNWRDACVIFRRIGLHALPAPIGETVLARRWLLQADIQAPDGPVTLGTCAAATIGTGPQGLAFSGCVAAAPWGAQVGSILIAARAGTNEHWLLLPTERGNGQVTADTGTTIAGEPRTALHFRNTPVLASWRADDAVKTLFAAGALLRACQMAGALEAALQLSIDYANERKQFGRSIGKFQAIQQQLAILAEETAAAGCAALSACHAADRGVAANEAGEAATGDLIHADFEIAAAKLRANRAAAQAATIAHQVHGAIGFTHEHRLHHFTLRLLAWRGEFGNDRHWAEYLGRLVCTPGAGSLWQQLTNRDPHVAPHGTA